MVCVLGWVPNERVVDHIIIAELQKLCEHVLKSTLEVFIRLVEDDASATTLVLFDPSEKTHGPLGYTTRFERGQLLAVSSVQVNCPRTKNILVWKRDTKLVHGQYLHTEQRTRIVTGLS